MSDDLNPDEKNVSDRIFNIVVLRQENSLNDLLSTFNKALELAGIDARYTQIQEDYAAWQSNSQEAVDRGKKFHSELTHSLSPTDVDNIIRKYRKGQET